MERDVPSEAECKRAVGKLNDLIREVFDYADCDRFGTKA